MSDVSNVAHEIEKLDELRTKGVISAEQFETRKTALLQPRTVGKKQVQKRPGTFLALSVIIISLLVGFAYGGSGAVILATMFGLFVYLLPAFIAYQRAHSNRHAILVINLFLGWSVIGWIGALIWSCTSSKPKTGVVSILLLGIASAAGPMLLLSDSRADELYPNITREHVASFFDLRDQASFCVTKKILDAKLPEAEERRLFNAVYSAAENAGIDYKAMREDPKRWIKSGSYEKLWDYIEFINDPIRPVERVSGGLRYTMTETEWVSEKQSRVRLATQWCTSIARQLRLMLEVLDAPR